MTKPILTLCLMTGSIMSCQVIYAQFDPINSPQSIEKVKKMRTEIPSWETLKSTVYAGIPYPDKIERKYWDSQLNEYISKNMDYSMKWYSISMFRETDVIRGLSDEANKMMQFMGGDNELSKLLSIIGQQTDGDNPMNQGVKGSQSAIGTHAIGYDSQFALELGLQHNLPKDNAPELKAESQRLEQQVKKSQWSCDSLLAEAQEGAIIQLLNDELQDAVQKHAGTISLSSTDREREQFEANVQKIAREWYRKNYMDDGGRGLMAAEKANLYMIDSYLPLAEKRILVDSRVYGFEPSPLLQELYLDALIKLIGCRIAMLREMAVCFDN